MFSSLNHVGFNITKTKLQLVEVVKEKGNYCLENVDEEPFDENGFHFNYDESNFINTLQTAFTSLTNRNFLKSKNVSFAIPTELFKFFKIPFEPSLSDSAFKKHLEWEFKMLFPTLDKNDYFLQKLQLAKKTGILQVLVVALPKNIATSLYEFCKHNNLRLRYINAACFSSDSIIDKSATLSLYVEQNSVSIAFYTEGELFAFINKQATGTNKITDILLGFVKQTNITYDSVYIAGTEDMFELKTYLEETLNTPVKMFNPFATIKHSETFIQNGHFLNTPNSFAAAAGICYRKF
jgi:Tfp pilus assembly PilM family ATPase